MRGGRASTRAKCRRSSASKSARDAAGDADGEPWQARPTATMHGRGSAAGSTTAEAVSVQAVQATVRAPANQTGSNVDHRSGPGGPRAKSPRW